MPQTCCNLSFADLLQLVSLLTDAILFVDGTCKRLLIGEQMLVQSHGFSQDFGNARRLVVENLCGNMANYVNRTMLYSKLAFSFKSIDFMKINQKLLRHSSEEAAYVYVQVQVTASQLCSIFLWLSISYLTK